MVFVMAAFGAFGLTGNLSGPATVLVFAILGWAMRRYDYSIPAAVIGLLLGSMADGELIRSIQIGGGRFAYLLGRPITLVLLLLFLLPVWLPDRKGVVSGTTESERVTFGVGRVI